MSIDGEFPAFKLKNPPDFFANVKHAHGLPNPNAFAGFLMTEDGQILTAEVRPGWYRCGMKPGTLKQPSFFLMDV